MKKNIPNVYKIRNNWLLFQHYSIGFFFNDAHQFHILCGHLLFRHIFLVTVAGDNSEKADMVIIKLGSLAHYLEQIDNKRQQLQ